MTDRPIIFSAPMVRALLDERKTQTRRLIRDTVPEAPAFDNVHPSHEPRRPAPYLDAYCGERKTAANLRGMGPNWCWWTRDDRPGKQFQVGYMPGDRLWVREGWTQYPVEFLPEPGDVWYRADGRAPPAAGSLYRWKPSIHMPRWASRLTLTVTDVRVQRLQEISEDDARAEGITDGGCTSCGMPEPCGCDAPQPDAKDAFAWRWNSLHGPDAWAANPWIAALTFTVERRNIDAHPAQI